MAGALLVASIVNFVLLIGERQRALLIEQSGFPIARFVDVSRDVITSPPALGRPAPIVRQGPGRYQVQASNQIDSRSLPRDAGLEHRLHAALLDAGLTPGDIRASVQTITRPERGAAMRERLEGKGQASRKTDHGRRARQMIFVPMVAPALPARRVRSSWRCRSPMDAGLRASRLGLKERAAISFCSASAHSSSLRLCLQLRSG